MPGPQRRKFSAKKSARPGKPASRPAESQRAGRIIGFEGGEAPVPGPARPKRPPKTRPTGPGSARRPFKSRIVVKRRRPRPRPAPVGEPLSGDRLQKVLAAAGLGSRRQCEELITTGRVEIDRKVVTQLGTRVDSATQEIRVDGESLSLGRRVYYAVNKPKGVVTTNRDPGRRPRVIDLVPNQDIRLFAIGRLDLNSEGLILVTNDGELANRLTHPRYGVEKVYLAQVAGRPTAEILDKLRRGVHLAEGVAKVEEVRIESHQKESTWLEIILREGMNREIRRLLARVGHKVLRLVRVAVGPVRLGKLPPGTVRPLLHEEIQALRSLVKNPE
jgi:23S rRNA pseudouridine2605 synthase